MAYYSYRHGQVKNNPTKALAAAFGVNTGKGENTVWSVANWDRSNYKFIGGAILKVAEERSNHGKMFNISGLIAEVMEQQYFKHLSNRTGWHAWRKYKRAFPERAAALEHLPGFRASKATNRERA